MQGAEASTAASEGSAALRRHLWEAAAGANAWGSSEVVNAAQTQHKAIPSWEVLQPTGDVQQLVWCKSPCGERVTSGGE